MERYPNPVRKHELFGEVDEQRRPAGSDYAEVRQAVNILFLENHAVFAKQVTGLFLSDHCVTVVPSVSAARDAFKSGRFALVLADYDLDDGKGDEFVRECRNNHSEIPIIAVSSRDEGNTALLAAGASAVCPKMQFHRISDVIGGVL